MIVVDGENTHNIATFCPISSRYTTALGFKMHMYVYRLCFITPFIIATGAIICILSLATPWWCVVSNLPEPIEGVHFGLWRACFSSAWETSNVCGGVTGLLFIDATWLNAVRAMVIISVLLSFATLPLAVISTVKNSWIFSTAAALLALAQAAIMMIGLAVFIGEIYKELSDFGVSTVGWSYGIGWAGVGFYIAGAVCLAIQTIMIKRENPYENIASL